MTELYAIQFGTNWKFTCAPKLKLKDKTFQRKKKYNKIENLEIYIRLQYYKSKIAALIFFN